MTGQFIPTYFTIHEEGEDEEATYDVVFQQQDDDCTSTVARGLSYESAVDAMHAHAKGLQLERYKHNRNPAPIIFRKGGVAE